MPFFNQTFLGSSIVSYTSNIGWGLGSPSQLQVALVEDPVNGDSFLPFRVGNPQVGQPVYFSHYGFAFAGLLQKWEERQSRDGKPVFDAIVNDPRDILEGAQVIINGYNGSTGGVNNLFNAYGWWESQAGFGASLATDAGMPWTQIYQALISMANSPGGTSYGGPLKYRGYTYGLDLSELPRPAAFYRVGGATVGLLDLIAQICEDGGCDFFIELQGLTIKVRTVSRFKSAPLGTITAITNTNWGGTVVRANNGLENRNELTSAFLIGGDVTTLDLTDAITQYWGLDIGGNPITGEQCFLWFPDRVIDGGGKQVTNVAAWPAPVLSPTQPAPVPAVNPDNSFAGNYIYAQAVPDVFEVMNLNAAPVSDIVGSVIYQCSTLEMRLAKVNMESWAVYMENCRPGMATIIGMTSQFKSPAQALGNGLGNAGLNGVALRNDEPNARGAIAQASAAVAQDILVRTMRMYQFVKGYADEYMGKKFLAGVPFVLFETDAETLQVRTSYEVTDGGFLPDGSQPLGLSDLNQDVFTLQDGRFRAFVRFDGVSGLDLSAVSPQGTVIENDSLFMEAQVGGQILFTPAPAVVVTLQAPVIAQAADPVGDWRVLGPVLQNQPAVLQVTMKQSFVPVKVAPLAQVPTAIAIPLKSNILTYGPWFAQGAPGKVKVDLDTSLTPWNYGGWDQMNQAGNIRVASVVTDQQITETGTIELAGTPTISIGSTLKSGGPNLTGIDVQISGAGVTTSYRFSTFTPKFGVFSKGYIERLRRMSIASMQLRREVRTALKRGLAVGEALGNAERSARAFMALAPAAFKRQSPHDVLVSFTQQNASGDTLTIAQSATYEEAIALSNADDAASYQATAIMSITGLLRPFCTNPSATSNFFSKYTAPNALISSNAPSKTTLDPWKAKNDIEVYAWGNTYGGLHAYRRGGGDFANARPMALRGPLVVTGWGYAIDGTAVPGTGDFNFGSGYLTNQQNWKTGPVDLLWNPWAGTWTCHDLLRGALTTACAAASSGTMQVATLNGVGAWKMTVWNHFGTAVGSGKNVIAGYVATDNRWYLIAADC